MSAQHVCHGDNKLLPHTDTAGMVVVHDPRLERLDGIEHLMAGVPPDCDCRIALVGVAERPPVDAPILDTIRRLKSEQHTVVCYAPGANEWPVSAHCHLLLAGASRVFDCSTTGFTRELVAHVSDLLRAAIVRNREQRLLRQQMLELGIVGSSPAMTAVFSWIVRASMVSDLPVLIVGETGTGKELAARAIHRLDKRRCDRPFVAVNCGAISAGVAESELFGHHRGAFTGADHDRLGLIRAAHGGVLFLDEIGDLELSLQGKLLRVLQEGRVLAVGADHERPIDVRIIAATNRDIDAMVKRFAFRADLFHRLNVLSIRVPPLRERPEDIAPLVEHFLGRCAGHGQAGVSASPEFIDALQRVELPGNVRQLDNVVRRAAITAAAGDNLRLGNLTPEFWIELSRADGVLAADPPRSTDRVSPVDATAVLNAAEWKLERALDLCERHLLTTALGASSGNRSRAARLLGISPRCIFNKMRKHRLTA